MELAIGAIGIAVVVMVGFVIISQVKTALPTPQATYDNQCRNLVGTDLSTGTTCYNVSTAYYGSSCGTAVNLGTAAYNTSATVVCNNGGYVTGIGASSVTIFAGFSLVAVGIIVMAAFGLINIFK
jgi:hypothetical protein